MSDLSDKLSAYLDGELPDQEALQVEDWLERDPQAQAQLEALMHADSMVRDAFDAQLQDPVPLELARAVKSAPMPEPEALQRRPIWGAMAASLVMLMIGGAGGYALRGNTAPVQTAGWLHDIADYHAVYAGQGRHLVEVAATESDHIEAWLGKTIGAAFAIPDLSAHGLTFQGGRLLVANGAPVAQLMYRDDQGRVIALCLQSNPSGDAAGFNEQTINGFDFVSWRGTAARYVVIGPQGRSDLNQIAETAADLI